MRRIYDIDQATDVVTYSTHCNRWPEYENLVEDPTTTRRLVGWPDEVVVALRDQWGGVACWTGPVVRGHADRADVIYQS